ncbi:TPA: SprT-like domain-containing protein [Pseudomonas putida]
MPKPQVQPTPEAYSELQFAYDFFNQKLFDGQLPDCLITLQRERKTEGYFSPKRFVRRDGLQTDEIAMNPSYFIIRPIKSVLSTLVHEMAHLWQQHFGKPGRRGYHNQEWASKMESIGLMPSDTGEPGGRKVGERMSDYVISGGRFDQACTELVTQAFQLSWLDRFPPERPRAPQPQQGASGHGYVDDAELEEAGASQYEAETDVELEALGELIHYPPVGGENKSNRSKYKCPMCKSQIWGKPGMLLSCSGRVKVVNDALVSMDHPITKMQPVD